MKRVTVLTTHTNNTPVFYEPLRGLDHEVSIIVYDLMSPDAFGHLPWMVDANKPDWVLLIGAHPDYHGRPTIPTDILAAIGARHPLVHFCCDGAEPVWWPVLQEYYDRGRFALQVNIDGVRIGPIGDRGLTMLTPIDPTPYPQPRAWADRGVSLGFAGSRASGQARGIILEELVGMGVITVRDRNADEGAGRDDGGVQGYRDFLGNCRVVLNHASTGSSERKHVKGRPIEAALAGALVLEQGGSPLANWFDAGVDFLTYDSAEDAVRKARWADANQAEARQMADRMRAKVLAEHTPAVFWSIVLERLGLGETRSVLREVPLMSWSIRREPYDETPRLVMTIRDVNLVSYRGDVYRVPQGLGTVDIVSEHWRKHPSVTRHDGVDDAVRACA